MTRILGWLLAAVALLFYGSVFAVVPFQDARDAPPVISAPAGPVKLRPPDDEPRWAVWQRKQEGPR